MQEGGLNSTLFMEAKGTNEYDARTENRLNENERKPRRGSNQRLQATRVAFVNRG